MKSYKTIFKSLKSDQSLKTLSEEELSRLKTVFLKAYHEIDSVCKKNNIKVMLIGGSALGAVRHKGFIPWDDDLDIAMTRMDFEKFKKIFEKELGEKYLLCSPNYNGNVKSRFPKILLKGTRLLAAGEYELTNLSCIFIDLFIIENIPNNIIQRYIKGIYCNILMYIGSCVDLYSHQTEFINKHMCKTKERKRIYGLRLRIGRIFSFFSIKTWYNIIDKACRYNKPASYMGIPTGRGHYFKEIRKKSTFIPPRKVIFENTEAYIPNDFHDYLSNLYGDYMVMPPKENRESHFFVHIDFGEES